MCGAATVLYRLLTQIANISSGREAALFSFSVVYPAMSRIRIVPAVTEPA